MMLDDIPDGGSLPFTLPNRVLRPGAFVVFFRSKSKITLNDAGDTVRLMAPDGRVLDEIHYLKVRAYNLSYGRLPDGSGHLVYGLWPTPRWANLLFEEPTSQAPVEPTSVAETDPLTACPQGARLQPWIPRLVRHPAVMRWMRELGQVACRPG
jgi:hypothetical protein